MKQANKLIVAFAVFSDMFVTAQAQSVRPCVSNQSTIANTVYGKVQGYKDGNIYTFKGITYAEAERFMPP